MADFNALPEDCISKIVSLTSPLDACVVCLVSKLFKAAADSDAVWQKFPSAPLDSRTIAALSIFNLSKKQLSLVFYHPILIQNGKMSISLEKRTGKISVMLGARELSLRTSKDWNWISVPTSMFRENAKLKVVIRLEIHGRISTRALSKQTLYAAYFVFRLKPRAYGFKNQSIDVAFKPVGRQGIKRVICLNPIAKIPSPSTDYGYMEYIIDRLKAENKKNNPYLKNRVDGWLEIELGEFYNNGGMEKELEMSVMETKCLAPKHGLIVQGIEIRPKPTKLRYT